MKIIKLIVCILFGAMFVFAGTNKLFNFMPPPKDMPAEQMEMFMAMAKLKWLLPLLGITETIGGILFAIPKTRAFGAVFIFPVMVGILLHHMVNLPSDKLVMPAVLMLINLWMIADNWKKYQPMIS